MMPKINHNIWGRLSKCLDFFCRLFVWRSSPGKVQVMTKKTGKMTMPKEKEKGPPAYSVDDAMNKGSQLPQMLDFHKQRWGTEQFINPLVIAHRPVIKDDEDMLKLFEKLPDYLISEDNLEQTAAVLKVIKLY